MPDYQGNSKSTRVERTATAPPEKTVEKVVSGEVVVQKKTLRRKFKDVFVAADVHSVFGYVVTEVLIPAARNMIVDGATKGVERMMYGESTIRRRGYGVPGQSRITYNNPINRGGYRDVPSRRAPSPTVGPRSSPRGARDDFILSSREEAELVLERMNDIIDTYEVVSVADLNDLVGMPTSHIDNKWGWVYLGDTQVRQVREGYLIDLPPAEPIQS